jgi:hypothetical protein
VKVPEPETVGLKTPVVALIQAPQDAENVPPVEVDWMVTGASLTQSVLGLQIVASQHTILCGAQAAAAKD